MFSDLSISSPAIQADDAYYAFQFKQKVKYLLEDLWEFYYENDLEEKVSKYEFIKRTIRGNSNLNQNRDFILALCLIIDEHEVSYEGLAEEVSAFKVDYPASKYLPNLEEILAEHAELKNGMPLKDFSMQDSTGKEFNLSDLKGKLIYIDIWATWCGPCREEFKYSKELTKKYGNRSDLVFLYVSKDSKPELWKNFLRKNPELKGIHGIQPPTDMPFDESNVMRLYKINGIPRYIMIGKDGRIINYNASRPSQLVENTELDSLLKL